MKLYTLLVLALASFNSHALTNSVFAENEAFNSVVMIKSEAPDASGDTTPAFCNATFIAKNVMVTAAHCMALAHISGEKLVELQTGYYKYVTRPDGQRVRIGYVQKNKFSKHVNIELPQSLKDKFARQGQRARIEPSEDFALVWWNEETPELADMNFATPVTQAEHAQVTRSLSNYPLKVVSINFLSTMSMDTKRMGDLNSVKWSNNHFTSQSSVRVEEGDSGSPVFMTINNQLKLFAVVKGRAATVFSNWDVFPAVSPHLCELNKRMPTDMKFNFCLR